MALSDNQKPEMIAETIERQLNLDPPNTTIWFSDYQWTVIVKALRLLAESEKKS